MAKQSDRIVWVGYSWELTARHCCLCVSTDDARFTDGSREGGEPSISHYPLCWQANAEPVPPPPPGVVDTLGVSGLGGYLRESQSHLSGRECEWLEQVKLIDQGFERILADMLTGILNGLLGRKNDEGAGTGRTYVAIQGPAFPKLLGRMGYRRIREGDASLSVYFLTFRRRFLTPNPLVLEDGIASVGSAGAPVPFRGMIHGPLPSDHEEAAVRRYYILPATVHAPPVPSAVTSAWQGYSPLMLETFGQNTDTRADKEALVAFLGHLGIHSQNDGTIVVEENRIPWQEHPDTPAFRRVPVPAPLLAANRASLDKLREILGGERPALEAVPSDSVPIPMLRPIIQFVSDRGIRMDRLVDAVVAAEPARETTDTTTWFLRQCRHNADGVMAIAAGVAMRHGTQGSGAKSPGPQP